MKHVRNLSPLLACILLAGPVTAHEFWIDAPVSGVPEGAGLSADIRVGEDLSGAALPYLDKTIRAMTHHTPKGARPVPARLGDRPALQGVAALDTGLHSLTVETNPAYVVFDDMAAFTSYLAYEGLSEVVDLHRQRGLPETGIAEEYIRNARALVQVGPVDPAEADHPTGMPFEITVDGSPFARQDDTLVVRLSWQGTAVADTQIALFHLPRGGSAPGDTVRTVLRTDADGRARFPMAGAGHYLLNAVRMTAADGPGSVVWQSHWASLTFRITAE